MVKPIPMIAVADVVASSHWYQALLGCKSGHGGSEYDQIVSEGEVVLQLHQVDDDHPELGAPIGTPIGVALWFEVADYPGVLKSVQNAEAKVLQPDHLNPFANHREVWVQDPDGYLVVLASRRGDVAEPPVKSN